MGKLVDEFNNYRARMNDRILASDNKVMKRIYSVDTLTYQEGALSSKVKEMLKHCHRAVRSLIETAAASEYKVERLSRLLGE